MGTLDYYWHENEWPQEPDDHTAELRPFLVKSAMRKYIVGDHGRILLQSIPAPHFNIGFHHFFIEVDTWLYTGTKTGLVTIRFMLKGEVKGSSDNAEAEGMKEGTYCLLYVPAGERSRIRFLKGNYHSVGIDLELSFLNQMVPFFPQVHTLIDALNAGSTSGIRFPEGHITFRIRTVLEELGTAGSSGNGADLFLHARIYELLWLYLAELSFSEEKASVQVYFKKVQQVQQYIALNLDQDIGTSFLARHFTISATTLKRQFKLQYGLTIREFLLQQRMHMAKELLTHTDLPVHSVGARVGYPEFSSFTRAFTRFFGHSPIHLRRL